MSALISCSHREWYALFWMLLSAVLSLYYVIFFAPGHCISLLYAPTSIVLCFYWLCKCTSQSNTVMARLNAPWMARLQHNLLNTVTSHPCIAQAESNNGFQRAAALFSCCTWRTLFACRYSPKTFLRPSVSCLQGTWENMLGTKKILVTTSRPPFTYHHCCIQKKITQTHSCALLQFQDSPRSKSYLI